MFQAWLIFTGIAILVLVIVFRAMERMYVLSWVIKNFFWFFLIAILVFFAFSLTKIQKDYALDYTSLAGIKQAGSVYVSWLGTVFQNMGKVTGYAIQQDWTKVNVTNSSLIKK